MPVIHVQKMPASPDHNVESFHKAEDVRNEYVLCVRGKITKRDEEAINPNLPTGAYEMYCEELRVLNSAKTPPFYIQDNIDVDENIRLKYRYLDLRRPEMQRNLILRHKVTKAMRDFFDSRDFLEIETPMLTKSTPEGARDYLVPSRVNAGTFYALPQSPQIFKQILMVAGYEKYFQIVRCFRDEDLRADRQPEFTQLDLEMSFVDEEDIYALLEQMVAEVFKNEKADYNTRHTSSCSVVDCTQLAESHTHVCSSVYLHLSPSCNSNYLAYQWGYLYLNTTWTLPFSNASPFTTCPFNKRTRVFWPAVALLMARPSYFTEKLSPLANTNTVCPAFIAQGCLVIDFVNVCPAGILRRAIAPRSAILSVLAPAGSLCNKPFLVPISTNCMDSPLFILRVAT